MKSKLLVFVCLLVLCAPASVYAAPAFVSLVGIPGIDPNDPGLGNYINAIYRLSISLAALLAVVKIVIAGAKYMLDDIVTHKEEAKADIWGAVTGLLVILAAVLILTTINADLTHTDFIVDTVTFDPLVNTPQGAYAACEAEADGCAKIYCTDNADRILPGLSEYLPADTEKTCAAQCTAAGGLYVQIGTNVFLTCAISNATLATLKATYQAQLPAQYCTADEACYAESCDIYAKDYSILSFSTCSNVCTSTYHGQYDSASDNCIMNGDKDEVTQTVACTGTRDYTRGGVVDNRCTPEYDQCYTDGGYVASSDGVNLICRKPKLPISSCPEGQSLVTRDSDSCVDGVCTQITVCE